MVDIDIKWITDMFGSYTPALPIVTLIIGAMLMPGVQLIIKRKALTCALSLTTVVISGVLTAMLLLGDYSATYYGLLRFDAFSGLMLVLFQIVAFQVILISGASREVTRLHQGAYY